MRQKIFISYRRSDAAPEALSISQFLEREFGRGSVFMDVDIHAGTNFPSFLEQRLAESKVLLAIIGPNWLNATDKQGRARLTETEDWVRLEISRALAARITVIPVCINQATLPDKTALPEDLQGLVDHQAAFVSTSRFRNDMAGLVRDIRAIPDPFRTRRIGLITASCLVLLAAVLFCVHLLASRAKPVASTPVTATDGPSAPSKQPASIPLKGSIQFRSEPGDYIGQGLPWDLTSTHGNFTAQTSGNTLTIDYHGDDDWSVTLAAPQGERLAPGAYLNATRAPFNSPKKPGLSVDGAGRGCNTLTGEFNIRQIEYSSLDGTLKRLLADFEQHCEGGVSALSGTIDVTANDRP